MDVFFDNVQRVMAEKNISRAELARLLGTHPPAITRMFVERENISIGRIETIASALEVPIPDLFEKNLQKASA